MAKTITLYHGTTHKAFESIKKELFKPKDPVWDCSVDSDVYFFQQDSINNALDSAKSNAQIAAALKRQSSKVIGIVKIIVPMSIFKEVFAADTSCEAMDDVAVSINYNQLNTLITEKKVKTFFLEYEQGYNPIYRDIYLMNLYANYNLDIKDPEERQYLELLANSITDPFDIYEELHYGINSNIVRKEAYAA